MIVTSLWPFSLPSFFSTVTPGQLPTNWLEPVSALNNVVLPQLGLPASAILIDIFMPPLSFQIFFLQLSGGSSVWMLLIH